MRKFILTISFLIIAFCVYSQSDTIGRTRYYFVTDSVVWKTVNINNIGNPNCMHIWIYSDLQFTINNNNELVTKRQAICKRCKRKETYKQLTYTHRERIPKTEYEALDDSINNQK